MTFWNPASSAIIPGRAAGLYVQPNTSGMALVFGCLTGLTVYPSSLGHGKRFSSAFWLELLRPFRGEALLALTMVAAVAGLAGVLSLRRLVLVATIGLAMFVCVQH